MMKAILACDSNWGIGLDGGLPWGKHYQDLSWFKMMTTGKTVIMGRSTWDSTGMPRPLPNRRNIVISNNKIKGIDVDSYTFDEFTETILPTLDPTEACLIGGSTIFTLAIPYIKDLHLSRIAGKFTCDTFLPEELIKSNFDLVNNTPINGLSIELWRNKKTD